MCTWLVASCAVQAEVSNSELPLATKADIFGTYLGSFTVDYSDEVSHTRYSEGRIAYNPERHSIFIDSNHRDDAIAEFAIPEELSHSNDIQQLPKAAMLQPYRRLFASAATGNPHGIDKIGGMSLVRGELVVQAYETYDASGKNPHTTLIVRQPQNLAESRIDGFFEMEGAARTSMYISEVPDEWKTALGGSWIAGMGAGMSINSRFSEGPSLYVFDPEDFRGRVSGRIPTRKHLDYPFNRALSSQLYEDPESGGWDSYNSTGKNLLWTQISAARFAFVVPGTRTFAVIGKSGALKNSGGYKILNDEGYRCPGPCAYDNEDIHTYYWLYDLEEVLTASNTYDQVPYEYGIFDDRFLTYGKQGANGLISGGSFDAGSNHLYLIRPSVGKNGRFPVISIYKVGSAALQRAEAP
ncbi:MAG: hypothetical protein HKN13_03210 [Rhodothermales bacterium]|nr:hypothetical protein [Rhodothermales bacterium]